MGASNIWITNQDLEANKTKRNGFDLSSLGDIEYEQHPFQPSPLASRNEPERSNTAHAKASTRVTTLQKDLRRFDRDISRRIVAH